MGGKGEEDETITWLGIQNWVLFCFVNVDEKEGSSDLARAVQLQHGPVGKVCIEN